MAFNTPLTKTENIVLGNGVCYFAKFDANGRPMGEEDLGEVESLTLAIESSTEKKFSMRTALRKLLREWTTQTDFAGNFTVNDMSTANLARVLAGSVTTVTQSSTPVANERIYNAESGREYQLGTSDSNPSGVRNVGSVTVSLYELENAAARANSTAVVVGQIFKSGTDVFLVTTAGTTAGSAPSYDTSDVGDPTTDGTAVVKFLGTTGTFTVVTDYVLSAEAARIGIEPAGDIGLACDLYTAVTLAAGTALYLSLNVDYTPVAESRGRASSSGNPSIEGQFRFIGDNAMGENRDVFIPSCKLAVNGELPLIGEDIAAVGFTLSINEKNSSTALVIIDERSPA